MKEDPVKKALDKVVNLILAYKPKDKDKTGRKTQKIKEEKQRHLFRQHQSKD